MLLFSLFQKKNKNVGMPMLMRFPFWSSIQGQRFETNLQSKQSAYLNIEVVLLLQQIGWWVHWVVSLRLISHWILENGFGRFLVEWLEEDPILGRVNRLADDWCDYFEWMNKLIGFNGLSRLSSSQWPFLQRRSPRKRLNGIRLATNRPAQKDWWESFSHCISAE